MNMDLAIYLFKEKIRDINIPAFRMMLDNNISLTAYFKDRLPSKIAVSSGIKLLGVDVNKVTPNLILNCVAEANPAAYNLILSHENGTKWLKKSIEELREKYT